MHQKGFTLIEFLVVVLIIGILAAIALPQYKKAVTKSKALQLQTLLAKVADAGEVYFLANGRWPTSLDDLDVDTGLQDAGSTTTCGKDLVARSVKKGKDFEITLYTGGIGQHYRVSAHFTTGKYKCTGFIYYFDENNESESVNEILNHHMLCVEHYYNRSCGTDCEKGAFCKTIMGKKYKGYTRLMSYYI